MWHAWRNRDAVWRVFTAWKCLKTHGFHEWNGPKQQELLCNYSPCTGSCGPSGEKGQWRPEDSVVLGPSRAGRVACEGALSGGTEHFLFQLFILVSCCHRLDVVTPWLDEVALSRSWFQCDVVAGVGCREAWEAWEAWEPQHYWSVGGTAAPPTTLTEPESRVLCSAPFWALSATAILPSSVHEVLLPSAQWRRRLFYTCGRICVHI